MTTGQDTVEFKRLFDTEAVPQLKRLQDIINVKLGDYSRSFGMREVTYQQLDDLNNLIKQAEDN